MKLKRCPDNGLEKKKALLAESVYLMRSYLESNRGKTVFEWDTFKIVEIDVLSNEMQRLGTRGEVGAIQAFRFQATKEAFHYRFSTMFIRRVS